MFSRLKEQLPMSNFIWNTLVEEEYRKLTKQLNASLYAVEFSRLTNIDKEETNAIDDSFQNWHLAFLHYMTNYKQNEILKMKYVSSSYLLSLTKHGKN